METINNTSLTLREITSSQRLFTARNNWRCRNIVVYAHPRNPYRVISVGVSFDQRLTVICDESRDQWGVQLAKIAGCNPKIIHHFVLE